MVKYSLKTTIQKTRQHQNENIPLGVDLKPEEAMNYYFLQPNINQSGQLAKYRSHVSLWSTDIISEALFMNE